MPKLLLKFDSAVIKEIPLDKDSFSVGRKSDNDIAIKNPAVSGRHCKISRQGGVYFVEDLGSTNGTFVNGKRVKKSGLHHNDVVGIAKHSLVFVEEVPPAPVAAPAPAPAPAIAPIPEPRREPEVFLAEQKKIERVAAVSGANQPVVQTAWLRVLNGAVGDSEYELKGTSTYLGKSDRVQILIKGAGLFGTAPEVAASIHRRSEGVYVLLAVTDGYPSLNGKKVSGSALLANGDIIECGSTTFHFELRPAAA